MSLRNVKVEKIDHLARYREVFGKESSDVSKMVEKFEPESVLSFELHDVDSSIANSLRRCAIGETTNIQLNFDVANFSSNSSRIIGDVEQIRNRIRLMKLNQDCPRDVTFSIDVVNDGEEIFKTYYASDLVSSNGKKYFFPNVRIVQLNNGEFMKIKNIKAHEGIGLNHAGFQVPMGFSYETLDYVEVDLCSTNNYIVAVLVKWDDIKDAVKGKRGTSVLIDAEKRYEGKDYDTVIHKNIKFYNSDEIKPKNYALSFKFADNIDPKKYMNHVLKTLVQKLKNVLNFEYAKQETDTFIIELPEETATIGNLITMGIYAEKSVANVNYFIHHLTDVGIKIMVKDGNAKKLLTDAVNARIALLQKLAF